MASYQVILTDRSVQEISEAHAFQQEGPMTTFFRNDEDRNVVDSWSTRVFSVRTAEVLMIRRVGDRSIHAGPDRLAAADLRGDAMAVSVGAGNGNSSSGGGPGPVIRPCARRALGP